MKFPQPTGVAAMPGWLPAATVALLSLTAATYATALTGLVTRWRTDPDYVHGFLVPLFSAFLLWHRREMLNNIQARGSLWGLPLLALAAAMRVASSYYYYDLLDPASLVPCLAGMVLFVGGWQVLYWAWPSIVFLAFMVPLPGFVAVQLGQPLQRLATVAGTFVIQTVGIPAVAEGNVILMSDSRIGVAEACNGLRNMMLFLAVCVAMSFVIRRTWIEKIIVVFSAAAIALVANLVRIAVTAVLHEIVSHEAATTLYHDLAGWFMMPLAVMLLWLELAYLRRVFVPRSVDER
jgi:exosortase